MHTIALPLTFLLGIYGAVALQCYSAVNNAPDAVPTVKNDCSSEVRFCLKKTSKQGMPFWFYLLVLAKIRKLKLKEFDRKDDYFCVVFKKG